MGIITAIAIVLLLIVISILLMIFLPQSVAFFPVEEFPHTTILKDYYDIISEECKIENITNTITYLYTNKFNMDYPETCRVISCIPNIKHAMLVKIDPKTEHPISKGPAWLANSTLRVVMPIKTSAVKKSGVWVDGQKKLFLPRELYIYDNSREHSLFNNHKRNSTLLCVIDIEKSKKYKYGISDKNHYWLL